MAPAVEKMQEDVDSTKKGAKSEKDKTEKKEEPELVGTLNISQSHSWKYAARGGKLNFNPL